MASVKGNMKGFYRQRKTTATKKSSKKSPNHGAKSAKISDRGKQNLQSECNDSEVVLRQFDLNSAYGPCLGIGRLARWERAQMLGLNPPQEIASLLKGGEVQVESLWGGRI